MSEPLSFREYLGDGATALFPITFEFLSKSHVKAALDGVPTNSFDVENGSVQFGTPPATNSIVKIYRQTPVDAPLVDFTDAAKLTEEELEMSQKQNLFATQEVIDKYVNSIDRTLLRIAEGNGIGDVTPEELLDNLVNEIINDELAAELQARINEINDNAESIIANIVRTDALQNRIINVEQDTATIKTTQDIIVTDVEALATTQTTLTADIANNTSLIETEQTVRANEDGAIATRIDNLFAVGGVGTEAISAAVTAETTARVNEDGALASRIDNLFVDGGDGDGAIKAGILEERTARISGDEALASSISTLGAQVDDNIAAIQAEQTARADQDTILASQLTLLGATSPDGFAWYLDETKVQVFKEDGTTRETLGSRLSGFSTAIGNNTSAIASEQSARVTADEALASDITNLTSRVTDAETDITGNSTAYNQLATRVTNAEGTISANSNSITSLDSRLTDAEGSVTGNASAITGLTTRVSDSEGEITALSSSVTSLSTTVDGHTTSITSHAASINGLEGRAGLSIDANGHVVGWELNNNGSSGSFVVTADKFSIVDPGDPNNLTTPFEVVGGITYIKEAVIQSLTIGRLGDGSLNATMNLGTGKIVFDNGTYVKVQGVGFGSMNQFIEWFGPKVDYNLMTESNAISFIKTNGDAYFGGTLHSGTLTTAGTTSDQTNSASIEVGPFGSNGGSIVVTQSYSFSANYEDLTPGATCPASMAQPSATIILERKEGSGNWATVATRSVSGSATCEVMEGVKRTFENMSGSWTYTDPVQSTSDRTYRFTIQSRSSFHVQANVNDQKLTLRTIEE